MISSHFENVSSMSAVKAKVDILGSALPITCTCSDILQEFTVGRQGDMSKFFGFGICQRLSLKLIDIDRMLNLTTDNTVKVYFGDGDLFDLPYPTFYITEVNRDEKNNSITATAYDRLILASKHTFSELGINAPYTIKNVAEAIASLLELTLKVENVSDGVFDTYYPEGANLSEDRTEPLRQILDAIAEATQTIYFINNNEQLVFKRLDKDGDAVLTITKDIYYEMNTKTNRRLSVISSVTELGDNVEASTQQTGSTQYIRDNPFWELRTDLDTLLTNALSAMGGFTINQFDCDWSGDWTLEIGDKIDLVTEDNGTVTSYILSDTISYDGAINEDTEWVYTEKENDTASNPVSLGDKINQTFARVDKVNKEIELLVGTASENASKIASLEVKSDQITSSVQSLETFTTEINDATNSRIDTLSKEVALKLDEEGVEITVEKVLEEGVEKVVTSAKKYTFDDSGLNISSNSSNISTTITEDGMRIYRNSSEVLTANNEGVKAEDLHATTFLIIGNTSRLEDRENRTTCFWIGD